MSFHFIYRCLNVGCDSALYSNIPIEDVPLYCQKCRKKKYEKQVKVWENPKINIDEPYREIKVAKKRRRKRFSWI